MRLTFNTPAVKALCAEVETMTHQEQKDTLEEVTWLIEALEERLSDLVNVRNKLWQLKKEREKRVHHSW